jgi:glycosyltransferase involved in cell wall biosynthesis
MRLSAVICSYGRPDVLDDTVASLLRQTTLPQEILIVCPSADHVRVRTLQRLRVRLLLSKRGLTIQRNCALDNLGDADVVAFIDDDMELCDSYFANMLRLFAQDTELIVASGRMLADGGRADSITREQALALCASAEGAAQDPAPLATLPLDYGYGCNLIVRASVARKNRFDERLALYAWLEDSDFSYHCTLGKKSPVINLSAQCVHLGWRGSRISGLKMGYSQIINPFYLWQKARVFSLRHILVQYWMRCLVANCLGLLNGKPEEERASRLKGNLRAVWHLLNGHCDPMAVSQLQ